MKRLGTFIFGVVSYLIFLASFLYAIGFVGDVGVPKTVNNPPSSQPMGIALVTNLLLLGLFAIQHSGMARTGFKRWLKQMVPAAMERSIYVLSTSLLLFLIFWQWQPINATIWSVESGIGRIILWTVFAGGWTLVLVSTFLIDHFDLFGLRQVYLYLRNRPYEPVPFQTPALYKYIRHPIMLGFLIGFWVVPHMTLGHLVFSVTVTGYVFVGVYFEERDMVKRFGSTYEEYRENTAMLIPGLK